MPDFNDFNIKVWLIQAFQVQQTAYYTESMEKKLSKSTLDISKKDSSDKNENDAVEKTRRQLLKKVERLEETERQNSNTIQQLRKKWHFENK